MRTPVCRAVLVWLALASLAFAQQPQPEAASPPTSAAQTSAPPTAGTPAPASPTVAPDGQAPAAPTAANTIRANARLVVLDAFVIDRSGKVVTDLTKEQFQVKEDGAEQTVLNFASPGRFTPSPELTIDSTAELDRLAPRAPVNIILLDEFNTLFEDMAFARYSLKKWLNGQPAKLDTPTMLIAVSLQKFEVLHDYTQNKDAILSALDHHFSVYPWQAHNYAWIAERYAMAFYTLRRVAEATTGHIGHKNMIWIGRGMPNVTRLGFNSLDQDRINNAVQQTVNELRDARVTLYTIDPAGVMVDPGRYGMEAQLFEPFGGQRDFKELARATGGRNLFGRNDVDAEIGTSIRDGASLYTLTYRPTNTLRDVMHFRRISISIAGRPDLAVVTRQGYFDSRAPARLSPSGEANRRLVAEVGAAETSTMVYDAVPLTATTGSAPGKYVLHTDARYMPWTPASDTQARQTRLLITTTLFDKKNKFLRSEARAVVLTAKASEPPTGPLQGGVSVGIDVPPEPKATRVRFVVRSDITGRMGTADVNLTGPSQAVNAGPKP